MNQHQHNENGKLALVFNNVESRQVNFLIGNCLINCLILIHQNKS